MKYKFKYKLHVNDLRIDKNLRDEGVITSSNQGEGFSGRVGGGWGGEG